MKRSRMADFSLLLVAMMWGCTFLIVQNAVKVLPPLAFNSIRFTGAALLLALITFIFYRKEWKQLSFRMVRDSLLLGLFCLWAMASRPWDFYIQPPPIPGLLPVYRSYWFRFSLWRY